MDNNAIIAAIDAEIAKLQEAKRLLSDTPAAVIPATTATVTKRRGRPKGSASKPQPALVKGKRTMSPEARVKIAAAQKARWAKTAKK